METNSPSFAAQTGLRTTVCHLPPGTSKWNKIKHRLFSAISRNWRGRPLESHEVIIETLRAVTTTTGLTCTPNSTGTPTNRGIRIPDKDMKTLEDTGILTRHDVHGDWNYSFNPRDTSKQPTSITRGSEGTVGVGLR